MMEGTVVCREKNKRAVRSQQSAFDNGQREGRRKPFQVSSSLLPRATKHEGRRDRVGRASWSPGHSQMSAFPR
ncbi:hypothetical protein MHYP_G00225690 [Metynnis hypsauchen]